MINVVSDVDNNKWFRWGTVLVVLATLCLIGMGGLVTSREVGMAVYDWPTSFGYNMFLLPLDRWLGEFGVFEEHSHRLLASLVGLMTAGLTGWLWIRETRGRPRIIAIGSIVVTLGMLGVRTQVVFIVMAGLALTVMALAIFKIIKNRSALRWWATLAYSMVIVQGVLGGLRVTRIDDQIGIFHGVLAQLFLVVLGCLALFSSRWWRTVRAARSTGELVPRVVRSHFLFATILIFLQLILGATMRHQHAGLPVWDFPKAHGQWWPATDKAAMARYNKERSELQTLLHEKEMVADSQGRPMIFLSTGRDIQSVHVSLHMAHRVLAIMIVGLVLGTVMLARRKLGAKHMLSRLSLAWMGLILFQAILGALAVVKYKPADIATLHVVCGAVALMSGAIGTIICRNKHLPAAELDVAQVDLVAMTRGKQLVK